MSLVELHAIVYGRVQGVFFRDTTRKKAAALGITGTVKNLSDGTVEIFAIGEREKLDLLMEELSSEEGPGNVSKTDLSYSEPKQDFEDFRLIF
jgi:acylphosphatase